MRKLLIVVLGLALSASAGIAVASGMLSRPATAPEHAGEGQPATKPQVAARARDPRGGREIGLVIYENQSGQTCTATGQLDGDRVGVHGPNGFEPLPLREGGACGGMPDPITVAVARNSETGVATIWGRGTADVTKIDARTAGRGVPLPLQSRKTYLAVLEDFDGGSVELRVRLRSGETRVVHTRPFPPVPSGEFDRVRKEVEAGHEHP